jgi:hypothetical protein
VQVLQPRLDTVEFADVDRAVARREPGALPLVALVLGVAGVVLGITVLWYFAAIPVGLAAVVVGTVALRRCEPFDHRNRGRSTIGGVLGGIAVVLGISAAVFLPRMIHRADNFFSTLQGDVNDNVALVTDSVQQDVNRIDRNVNRDLRRLERSNQQDVSELNAQSRETVRHFEAQLAEVERRLSETGRHDLTRLDEALRQDLRATQAQLRSLEDRLSKLEGELLARVAALEAAAGG